MRRLMMAALFLTAGCNNGTETRTFLLHNVSPDEAAMLIEPYVGGAESIRTVKNPAALTVSGTSSRLDQIEQVLTRIDAPRPDVQLRFQIIEADGFTEVDPAIQDVQQALGELFRFSGYRLAAEVVAQVKAPGFLEQRAVAGEGREYLIQAQIARVLTSEEGGAVEMSVSLSSPQGSILSTSLTVPSGQTVVVGSARARAGDNTLILVVRPTLR